MSTLDALQPSSLWQYFSAICNIPHPSGHEEQIRNYIIEFAKEHNLEHSVDAAGNVIIKKPATIGMEDRAGVILQGHMDMVPQKNNDTQHDFAKDPILAHVDGEWVKARGTTLGSDNGIGMAATLAVLASTDVAHGPLEALFTSDEEVGMTGAQALQPGQFSGNILLNLDTEEEGELFIGCAGGTRVQVTGNYQQETINPQETICKTLTLNGLKGGHSGCDIHLWRGNAIRLMVRALSQLQTQGVRVVSMVGGSLANAIAREAVVVIAMPKAAEAQCAQLVDELSRTFTNELAVAEPNLKLILSDAEQASTMMSKDDQSRWLAAFNACPNGVLRMSDSVEGVVETSSNIGVLNMKDGEIYAHIMPRSLVESCQQALDEQISGLFHLVGANVELQDSYPGWTPNANSPILATMKAVYEKLFDKEVGVQVVHAGLECGLLGSKYPTWDMISFGPTIKFPHSPDEMVHIQSVAKFWALLVATLKAVPAK